MPRLCSFKAREISSVTESEDPQKLKRWKLAWQTVANIRYGHLSQPEMQGWHEQVELLQNFWRWLHLPSLSHFVQGLVANFDNGRMAKWWMRSRHQANEVPADDDELYSTIQLAVIHCSSRIVTFFGCRYGRVITAHIQPKW